MNWMSAMEGRKERSVVNVAMFLASSYSMIFQRSEEDELPLLPTGFMHKNCTCIVV